MGLNNPTGSSGPVTEITNGGGTVSIDGDGKISITAAEDQPVEVGGGSLLLETDTDDPDTAISNTADGYAYYVNDVLIVSTLPDGFHVTGVGAFSGAVTGQTFNGVSINPTTGASLTLEADRTLGLSGGNVSITANAGGASLNLGDGGTLGAGAFSSIGSGGLATQSYVDNAVLGLLDLKGSQNCSGNPNYPAASMGDVYIVSVAGKIGGASGVTVEAGDLFTATANNAGGTQASVGGSWVVTQANVAFGTNVATALGVAVGSAGSIVINGGVLGTPSSGTLTNCTGLPNASVTGLGALATVTPGAGVAAAATIAVNTAGGVLTLDGSGNATVPGDVTISGGDLTLTGAGTINGGAGNLTITSGTGNSRTLILRTTTSGGTATTAFTLNADQSFTAANGGTSSGPISCTNSAPGKGIISAISAVRLQGSGQFWPNGASGLSLVNNAESANANLDLNSLNAAGNVALTGATSVVKLKAYTVATLPAGAVGDMAYVTDALTPAFGVTLVGGGAVKTIAFFDGTNWTAR